MTDYAHLIDKEVWSFITRTEQHYPPDAATRSIDEQRALYNSLCREYHVDYPAGVVATNDSVVTNNHTVPIRRYSSAKSSSKAPSDQQCQLVFIHGGGFIMGDLESHDAICAELCDQTELNVISVDYRLAPEHLHPLAYEDCLAVVQSEVKRLSCQVLLCGDSAGGNLCAAVAHTLRTSQTHNQPSPVKGQVLIYPGLGPALGADSGGENNTGSYIEHANAPMLTSDDMEFYQKVRVATDVPVGDFTFAPLQDKDFSNLPETVVVSSACDPLADDGKHYCEAIKACGGNAHWRNEPGLVHGYLRARHVSKRAAESFEFIVHRLRNMAAE